jgi:hypothetical protein
MITPWPTNGSASASTSPLFMMVPYPSSSNLPINVTVYNEPDDNTGAIVGGMAIGALTVSSLFFLYNYLQPKQIQKLNEENVESKEKIDRIEKIEIVDDEEKVENADNKDMVNNVDIVENIEILSNIPKRGGNESKHSTAVKIELNKGLSYICVDTNDLEIIKQILIINGKRFRILEF